MESLDSGDGRRLFRRSTTGDRRSERLYEGRRCCIVIGDSRYGGVLVPSAKILAQLVIESGWEICSEEPVRAMRSSAQQGGTTNLEETLLILVNEG